MFYYFKNVIIIHFRDLFLKYVCKYSFNKNAYIGNTNL